MSVILTDEQVANRHTVAEFLRANADRQIVGNFSNGCGGFCAFEGAQRALGGTMLGSWRHDLTVDLKDLLGLSGSLVWQNEVSDEEGNREPVLYMTFPEIANALEAGEI